LIYSHSRQDIELLPDDPTEWRNFIGYVIHDVSRVRFLYFDAYFKQYGYNRGHWWTLGNIQNRGKDGISQSELARIMNVKKAMMGAMIDQLEEAGLVTREMDRKDRRIKKILVTEKGREVAFEIMNLVKIMAPSFNAGISDEDIDTTMRTLLQMRANILAAELPRNPG